MTDLDPLESLYFAALERAPADRPAYLDEACRDKPELRERVERLLAAKPQIGEFLQPPAATVTFSGGREQATVDFPGRDERIGAILAGKYKLIEAIGEGGMGSVYMAQQTEPVKRRVAVKVIKAGMDSKAVLARFEAERQALAMMDHPNIAKVLDAGTTESGRPYFVMELVKGVPITEYCDAHKLTPRQRLELFVPVCHAIQHAHQKGIIHRDIKPSNVLIALYDDKPVPKVIDFGVAKATGASLTDHSLVTGHGAIVGTPEYMSPEQASFNNLDIDTRSDVYSLGVLLYELLTGSTPVDRKSLGKAALLEILRIVREVEAPKPSAKLSTIDTLPNVAANRGIEPAKLSKLMKGELDWLVLKALEKDRARRYDTANGLARDIQRYLADELVEARPASTGYRLRKFVRRHKGQVVAASLVFFVLLAGIAGTTVGLFEAKKQERLAVAAGHAEADRAEGEQQAKQQALAAAEAEKQAKTAAEMAATQERAASAVLLLGLRESLRGWPRRRLEETPARPVSIERLLGGIVESMDRTLPWIYEEQPFVQARARGLIAYILDDLGLEEASERQYSVALALYRQASKDVVTNDIISTMDDLADSLTRQGKYAEAEPLCRQVVESYRRTNGEAASPTRRASITFAETLVGLGKIAEAERTARRALEVERSVAGDDADTTLHSMEIMARVHALKGEWEEAELLRVQALKVRRRVNTAESELRLNATEQLAIHFLDRGQPAAAEPLLRESLAIRGEKEPDSWTTFKTKSLLGGALLGQKKYTEAEPLLLKGYEGMKQRKKTIPPQGQVRLPEAVDRLIDLYTATNKPDDVKKWQTERAKYPAVAPIPRAVK